MARWKKSTIQAKAPKSIPWYSRDTIADLHRVQDQPSSFNRPYRAPKMDFKILITKYSFGTLFLFIVGPY